MGFRLPEPPNGWRAFSFEFATIVLGVLVALGAQELAQSFHWRREVKETREALDAELSRNMGAFQYRVDQMPCVEARVNEIGTWGESVGTDKPLQLKHSITRPPSFAVRTEVWDVIDGGIVSRIPLAQRLNYAGLYSAVRSFERLDGEETEAWQVVSEYEGSKELSDEERKRLFRALRVIMSVNEALPNFATTMNRQAQELSIRPSDNLLRTGNPRLQQQQNIACQAYL